MPNASEEELEYGDEIRGYVCAYCGGSLVWREHQSYCPTDGYAPLLQEAARDSDLDGDTDRWLRDQGYGQDGEPL